VSLEGRFCQNTLLKNNLTFPNPIFMPKSTLEKQIGKVRMPKAPLEKQLLESILFFRRGFWQKRFRKLLRSFFGRVFWHEKQHQNPRI
jgi:hypothetical protein